MARQPSVPREERVANWEAVDRWNSFVVETLDYLFGLFQINEPEHQQKIFKFINANFWKKSKATAEYYSPIPENWQEETWCTRRREFRRYVNRHIVQEYFYIHFNKGREFHGNL